MAFNPKTEYTTVDSEKVNIKDFYDYRSKYVTRPPYQRKVVWDTKKKQNLMDSLVRRYYIPKLVLREVRLSDEDTINEVIDGQQRITAVQEFFDNKYPLPESLEEVDQGLAGCKYKDLDDRIKEFVDKSLKYQVDIIKGIDNPKNVAHQILATEIFRRLQQGVSLNYMEKAHAKLSSLTRNFIVKYSDDYTFDYANYKPVDKNPDKHAFFSLLNISNNRMQHLQFMARFLMIEREKGYADLSDVKVGELIENARQNNGIGNFDYEKEIAAQNTLRTLKQFHEVFKDDMMLDNRSGIKEFSREYFIISIYLLIRYLHQQYVVNDEAKKIIKEFVYTFYQRWKKSDPEDPLVLIFKDNRQQGSSELAERDGVLLHFFYEYLDKNKHILTAKDEQRAFTVRQRIQIYREGKALCQGCGARVSWSDYHADHVIPHSKGGKTDIENAQLLCRRCNLKKGAKLDQAQQDSA